MQIASLIEQTLRDGLSSWCGWNYALIDYPNYANPGDCAIWAGTRLVLDRIMGSPPAYVASLGAFDARTCRAVIGDGPAIFLGGGNFGSLYSKHNDRRLAAMRALSENPQVLLPISVAEATGANRETTDEVRQALDNVPSLTVFAREMRSARSLSEVYGVHARLCPDTAHCLAVPSLPYAGAGIVRLMRCDRERRGPPDRESGAMDWTDSKALRWTNRLGKAAALLPAGRLRLAAYDAVADRKWRSALTILAAGESVLTDRLHGVILARLTGRPVRAIDNSTGKVAAYLETWGELLGDVSLSPTSCDGPAD